MHVDPVLPTLTLVCLAVVAVGFLMRRFGQPSIVGYLLTGLALGPHALGLITAEDEIRRIGGFGVLLLLFFVGMEVSPRRLLAGWRTSVLGTVAQVLASVGAVWAIGAWSGWPPGRIVLLGFVVSLSSTAVALRLLRDRGEMETPTGRDVLGILLVQDVAVIPMLIVLGLMSGETPSIPVLVRQLAGTFLVVVLVGWLARRDAIRLPLHRFVGDDPELQVFAGILVCLSLSLITAVLDLSTALGAFLAGMVTSAARETRWIHDSLEPFRVAFVAAFFVSIGMLLDLDFLVRNWELITSLTAVVLVTNTLINAAILRLGGSTWGASLGGAALLAPIGEFSFVLASVGANSGLISTFSYQATLATIAVTLIVGAAWTSLVSRLGAAGDRPAAERDGA